MFLIIPSFTTGEEHFLYFYRPIRAKEFSLSFNSLSFWKKQTQEEPPYPKKQTPEFLPQEAPNAGNESPLAGEEEPPTKQASLISLETNK